MVRHKMDDHVKLDTGRYEVSYTNSERFLSFKAATTFSVGVVNKDKTSFNFVSFKFCHSNSFSTEQDGELSCN